MIYFESSLGSINLTTFPEKCELLSSERNYDTTSSSGINFPKLLNGGLLYGLIVFISSEVPYLNDKKGKKSPTNDLDFKMLYL